MHRKEAIVLEFSTWLTNIQNNSAAEMGNKDQFSNDRSGSVVQWGWLKTGFPEAVILLPSALLKKDQLSL